MTDFVLVHSAWHGGWCWDKVKPVLESGGHRCLTPELPINLTFEHCVTAITEVIDQIPAPVVLVGHGLAGTVIAHVAEQMPQQIARLVYLAAFAPGNGQSIDSFTALNAASVLRDNIDLSDGMLVVKAAAVAQAFYHDCEAADINSAVARLRPQNPEPVAHKLLLSEGRFGKVPKQYIECVEDQAVHISLQRKMARDIGATHVNSLQTSHSPFFSAPAALAALIATTGIKDTRYQ